MNWTTFRERSERQANTTASLLSAPVIMELIEAVHEKGASFRFQARGYSMTPAIRDGDCHYRLAAGKPDAPAAAMCSPSAIPIVPRCWSTGCCMSKRTTISSRATIALMADGWVPAKNILGLITQGGAARESPFLAEPYGAFFCSRISI